MRNITPKPMSIVALVVGGLAVVIGGWLIYSDFETLLRFLRLFLGFFLLLIGLGILSSALRR